MNRMAAAGWSSLVARRAHNPKVVGSNPAPATRTSKRPLNRVAFFCARVLCVGLPDGSHAPAWEPDARDALRPIDAERLQLRSHAERGNDQSVGRNKRSALRRKNTATTSDGSYAPAWEPDARDAPRPTDAERLQLRSHAERGNDQSSGTFRRLGTPLPLQKAERRCYAGGERHGCRESQGWAMEGPSLTASGVAPKRGKSGREAGRPVCRGALLFGYFLLGMQEKVTRPRGRNPDHRANRASATAFPRRAWERSDDRQPPLFSISMKPDHQYSINH